MGGGKHGSRQGDGIQGASPQISVRRAKVHGPSGCKSHPARVVPAGSNRNGGGGNEAAEASDGKGSVRDSASAQAVTCSERRAGLEKGNAEADPPEFRGRPPPLGKANDASTQRFRRGSGDGMCAEGSCATREAPRGGWRGGAGQRWCREARNRPPGVADRVVVPAKPGNAGGGKDPWSGNGAGRSERQAIDA